MIYILKHRENGKQKHKSLLIEFVSNRFIRDYRAMKSKMVDFEEAVRAYEKNFKDRMLAIDEGNKEKVKELKAEFPKLQKAVEEWQDSDFFDERMKLIEYLYKTNDIAFEGREWWDENVEPSVMNELLDKAVVKDFADETLKKKALSNAMMTALSSLFRNIGDQSTESSSSTKCPTTTSS